MGDVTKDLKQPTVVEKVKQAIATGVEIAWENKPYVVALITGAVVFCQASGYPIPPWLYGLCAVSGCAALHSSIKAR